MPKKSVQHHEYNTVLKNIKIKVWCNIAFKLLKPKTYIM